MVLLDILGHCQVVGNLKSLVEWYTVLCGWDVFKEYGLLPYHYLDLVFQLDQTVVDIL